MTLFATVHQGLGSALSDVLALFVFRALPVTLAYFIEARHAYVRRAVVGLSYLWLARASTWSVANALMVLGVYLYFVSVVVALPTLARAVRSRRVTRGACFTLTLTLFLLVPGVSITAVVAKGAALLLGWDCALSGYSYCIEVAEARDEPDLRDCLFFILVNPSLVYANRGVRVGAPSMNPRGLLRAALGLGVLLLAFAFLSPLASYLELTRAGARAARYAAPMAVSVEVLVAYAAASGLASLQIGMLRQLGYEIPERYVFPLAARTPADFWRRWNVYVTGWLQRYIFLPTAGKYRRHHGVRGPWPYVLATTATFAGAGLLHDAFSYCNDFDFHVRSTVAFLAAGAVLLVWGAVLRFEGSYVLRRITALAGPVAFWVATLFIFAWWKT